MSSLPAPRTLLTNLLSSIPTPAEAAAHNPLEDADARTKSLLLTLHVLYPNELLPALDLLDRRLLTRFLVLDADAAAAVPSTAQVQAEPQTDRSPPPAASGRRSSNLPVYFVRSAQQPPKRFESSGGRFYDALLTHYEVRPAAWNCTCPAFAFAAFPPGNADAESASDRQTLRRGAELQHGVGRAVGFGGLARDADGTGLPPLCKHLLACVLVERCGMFAACAEVKEVSLDELGAWCAGWGG